jgi:Zn-dependent protease with chaperone function
MKQRTKFRHWLPLMMLGATLSAPLCTAPAQAGLFGLSEQEEIEAGRQVAAQAEKEYGRALPANDPMSIRVRTIGQQFARLSERKNIPYSYQVLANDKVLNAFAAPGGPIFVTRLLVTTAANDAELAYVLGHETAHIDRKHIVESVEKQQKAGLIAGVLGAVIGKKADWIGTVGGVAFTLWERGYSRDQESESDIVGVRWMSQLGYDPQAAISMLGKLDTGGRGGVLDKYLASHPAPKSRQQTVSALIAKENLTDVARRQGGPKAWMAGNGSNWNNAGYASNYTPQPSYPAPGTTYPPVADNRNDERINLGAPLALVNRDNGRVVLAPVFELVRWAGATARNERSTVVITRAKNRLELREGTTRATLNGERVTLSAAPVEYNGRLYAPIGALAQGMGGQATYDGQTQSIWVTIDNRRGYLPLQ